MSSAAVKIGALMVKKNEMRISRHMFSVKPLCVM